MVQLLSSSPSSPFVSLCSQCNYLIFAIHGIRVPEWNEPFTCWPPQLNRTTFSILSRLKQENAKWVCSANECVSDIVSHQRDVTRSVHEASEQEIDDGKSMQKKSHWYRNVFVIHRVDLSFTINGSYETQVVVGSRSVCFTMWRFLSRTHYSFPFSLFASVCAIRFMRVGRFQVCGSIVCAATDKLSKCT